MQRTPPELTNRSCQLRRDATIEEQRLWQALRSQRPRFTRQLVIDRHIVDFACRSCCLAVELDGGHHALQQEADARRTAELERRGWVVLRFWNNEVRENIEGVVQTILDRVSRAATHPQPLPSREGRSGAPLPPTAIRALHRP